MKPPLYALVLEGEKKKTKNGDRFFWQVVLKTAFGIIRGFMWNAGDKSENDPKFLHSGDIVEITSLQDQMAERGSIVVESFKRITKDMLPDKSILDFDKASEADIEWALNLIGDVSFWSEKKYHAFVMECLRELDKEKLRNCPAATRIHHSYQGGLLIHTAEVLELCRSIVESSIKRYPFINKDVVYASAILHDIGKVYTYRINELGIAESVTTEKMIGHLFYGMNLVQTVADKMKFEQEFVNEVLHCIASHHGLVEWGSLKEVQSIEAGIVSRVDYISSRNGMVDFMLKEVIKSNQPLQEEFKIYGDQYFASIGMKSIIEKE